MSALFEFPFRPPENEKSRSPHFEGTGWVGTISSPKKESRRSISLVLGISGKGEGQIETIDFMVAPFFGQQKSRVAGALRIQKPG